MIKKAVILLVILSIMLTSCGENTQTDTYDNSEALNNESNEEIAEEVDEIDDKDETDNSGDITKEVDITEEEKEPEEVIEIDYEAIQPYEVGHIMVVMYHGILDNPPFHRTEEDFIKDLQYMYDNGYRLISMRDYLDNNINVEPGYTPIVLTFDDGLSSTFSLEEVDGELVVKEGTAIGIIEAFVKEHPDFGKAAALYMNGYSAFEGAGTLEERLQWLVEHGYDIGNHTYSHSKLSQLNGEQVQEEIGSVDQIIKENLDGYLVDSITYPHGILPREEYRDYVKHGIYNSIEYNYVIGFSVGPTGAFVSPLHNKFNPYNCPRVRGSEGENADLWWYFKYYEDHPDYRYISDGKPNVIAVPEEYKEKVNKDKLKDKELYLY